MNSFDKMRISSEENIFNEQEPDYEKAELDQLRAALKRTHKERLLFATGLYKIQQTFNKAIVTHKPYTLNK